MSRCTGQQVGSEAGIVIDAARIEIMKVFKGEEVVVTPAHLHLLRNADLVFMAILAALDHQRLQRQEFVAVIVVDRGIGQWPPAPAFGNLVEGHPVAHLGPLADNLDGKAGTGRQIDIDLDL